MNSPAAGPMPGFFSMPLAERDPEIFKATGEELHRQQDQIELIASENIVSKAVLEAVGSVLTNKYAEGYPGRRYYGGCEWVDEVEQLAIDRAKELFGAELAHEFRPKLIVAGASAYPRIIDAARFREIADEVGALLMVDMAHFAGLVAAGLHPNPVEHADVVTSTTHKTLGGPRSGLVLSRAEHGAAIDKAVFPGLQGGTLCHVVAATEVCFKIGQSEA